MITKFKIYERSGYDTVDVYQLKKYLISKEFDYVFLDEILEKTQDELKIKSILCYDKEFDSLSYDVNIEKYHFLDKEDFLYTTDDLDDAKKEFYKIIEPYKNANKYNL
jgi:hypothetical protein